MKNIKQLEIDKILIIARYTFLELYRSRVLLNTLLLGSVILLVCFVASEFAYGVPSKVAIDFGLGLLSISAISIALFFGVNLLAREIEERTIYLLLSRPLSRTTLFLGRVLGLVGILILNILLLFVFTIAVYSFLGGSLDPLILWALWFIFLEMMIVLMIVIFFSMITNATLTIMSAIMFYIIGHVISNTQTIKYVIGRPILKLFLDIVSSIFPDLSKLNIKEFVVYKKSMPLEYLLNASFYGVSYLFIVMAITIYIFSRKNLD